MKMHKLFVAAFCLSMLFQPAHAQTTDEAIAMVDKGAAFMKKNGKDALIKEVNAKNPDFIQGELYLVVRGMDGTMLAHPANPKIVGKNMTPLPDADGKFFRKDILALAAGKGKGWVDYSYNNPTTNRIEKKSTYILKVDDVILESGIYKGK